MIRLESYLMPALAPISTDSKRLSNQPSAYIQVAADKITNNRRWIRQQQTENRRDHVKYSSLGSANRRLCIDDPSHYFSLVSGAKPPTNRRKRRKHTKKQKGEVIEGIFVSCSSFYFINYMYIFFIFFSFLTLPEFCHNLK